MTEAWSSMSKDAHAELKTSMESQMKNASSEMKKALEEIPYLKEVIMGGELAAVAFNFLKANAPE